MSDESEMRKKGKSTQSIHAGQEPDPATGAISVPIYQSSTFVFPNADEGRRRFLGESEGYIYTRISNPTTKAFEEAVTVLEDGYGAVATASGMAAVTIALLSFLKQGEHLVSTSAIYGTSYALIDKEFPRFGISCSFVDTTDIKNIEKEWKPNTKVLYIETPANPTIAMADIRACADFAHKKGALLIVDNTFMTPIFQRPLEMGADVVLHSITKAINGHADIVGGIVIAKNEELYKRISDLMKRFGVNMDPHQSWLALRGVKSLKLRVEKASENALRLAKFLEKHPKISWVRYPGLESHPQYALAKRQMSGFGMLMAFELKGGLEAGKKLMNNVKIATLAVSLGGIETLIQHPASMTHSAMSEEQRESANISNGLVRLSVGCEDYEDIEADIVQALDKVS